MGNGQLEVHYGVSLVPSSRDTLEEVIRDEYMGTNPANLSVIQKQMLAELVVDTFPEQTLNDIRARIEHREKSPLVLCNLPEVSLDEIPGVDFSKKEQRLGQGPKLETLVMPYVMEGIFTHFDIEPALRASRGRKFTELNSPHSHAERVSNIDGKRYREEANGTALHRESSADGTIIAIASARNFEQAGTEFCDIKGVADNMEPEFIRGLRFDAISSDPDEQATGDLSTVITDTGTYRALLLDERNSNPKALERFYELRDDHTVSHILERDQMLVWSDGMIYHNAQMGHELQDHTQSRLLLHYNGQAPGRAV